MGDIKFSFLRIKGAREAGKLLFKILAWLALVSTLGLGINWSIRTSSAERIAVSRWVVEEAIPAPKSATGSNESGTKAKGVNSANPSAVEQPNGLGQSRFKEWLSLAIANSPWLTGVLLLLWLILKIPDSSRKSLFEIKLEEYIDKPDYKGKAAFVDAFSEDFGKTVKAYAPKGDAKIFVFVDDLDRCEAPKAADLMQAINLMIGDGSPLFFVIGLDRAKVAASIAFKFREIAPYLSTPPEPPVVTGSAEKPAAAKIRAFGDEFLEKFIQISFQIPVSDSDQQAKEFISSLISPTQDDVPERNWLRRLLPQLTRKRLISPSDDRRAGTGESDRDPFRIENGQESERIRAVLLLVREILGHNPRRIKAFLNRYRLLLYIASSQGLLDRDRSTGKAEVTPEQLGKFIGLTSTYPEILAESLRNAHFFKDLELYLTWGKSENSSIVENWLSKPGVRGILSPPKNLTLEWENTESLKQFPTAKFVKILPAIPAPPRRDAAIQEPATPTEVGSVDEDLEDIIVDVEEPASDYPLKRPDAPQGARRTSVKYKETKAANPTRIWPDDGDGGSRSRRGNVSKRKAVPAKKGPLKRAPLPKKK
jgi:hypothetical protein